MAHQPNIFRKVRDARQDVISRLNDEIYSDQYELEKSRLDALDELIRYVRSFPISNIRIRRRDLRNISSRV